MSTLFVAAILVGVLTGICLFLISVHNRQKKKSAARLLLQFSRMGAEHGLSFSAQEGIPNGLFGLDGQQRKLLVLTRGDGHMFTHTLIDLDKVKSCTLQKQYSTAPPVAGGKPGEHLNRIVLRFDFASASLPAEVVFYDHVSNSVFELPGLTQKATHWELILTKLLRGQVKNTA